MPSVIGVHHTLITIPSGAEDEARRFYCELLGLTEIPKPESLRDRGGLWLAVGGLEIHPGIQDGIDRAALRSHVAYQVDDLAGWRDVLMTHGAPIEGSMPIPGYDRLEFRDPFGNRIELIAVIGHRSAGPKELRNSPARGA